MHLLCIFGIVQRTDSFGKQIDCDGFMIHIFDNSDKHIMIDVFMATVGYELLNNVPPEAEQLAKDYINMEEKELCSLLDEYHRYAK